MVGKKQNAAFILRGFWFICTLPGAVNQQPRSINQWAGFGGLALRTLIYLSHIYLALNLDSIFVNGEWNLCATKSQEYVGFINETSCRFSLFQTRDSFTVVLSHMNLLLQGSVCFSHFSQARKRQTVCPSAGLSCVFYTVTVWIFESNACLSLSVCVQDV